jgi:hypothetical protein
MSLRVPEVAVKAGNSFIEVDYGQHFKAGERIGGDVFLLSRQKEDGRIVCTLSDGLGSGVKANVLANLTATMAQRFVTQRLDVRTSATIIMNTLPVCAVRKISYSTFSIADITADGRARIIEYDNPPFLYLRGGRLLDPHKQTISLKREGAMKEEQLVLSELDLEVGDRLLFMSDGVTQSGMGSPSFPLGWRRGALIEAVEEIVASQPDIGARELSHAICNRARRNDGFTARDDITCAVVYFRKPRQLLIVTGPPVDPDKDSWMASFFDKFDGKRIISGGSTASLVARELGRQVTVRLHSGCDDVPPASTMEGADLVTEGLITLSKVSLALEKRVDPSSLSPGPVRSYLELLLDSDSVHFLVGTKINEAHQDPNIPVEMELRRTIVRKMEKILEELYLKETEIHFL